MSRDTGHLSFGVFQSQQKDLFGVLSFHNYDLNCLPSVSCSCLSDHSTGACSLIVYGSLNKHGTVFKPFIMKLCEVIWIFPIYL